MARNGYLQPITSNDQRPASGHRSGLRVGPPQTGLEMTAARRDLDHSL